MFLQRLLQEKPLLITLSRRGAGQLLSPSLNIAYMKPPVGYVCRQSCPRCCISPSYSVSETFVYTADIFGFLYSLLKLKSLRYFASYYPGPTKIDNRVFERLSVLEHLTNLHLWMPQVSTPSSASHARNLGSYSCLRTLRISASWDQVMAALKVPGLNGPDLLTNFSLPQKLRVVDTFFQCYSNVIRPY